MESRWEDGRMAIWLESHHRVDHWGGGEVIDIYILPSAVLFTQIPEVYKPCRDFPFSFTLLACTQNNVFRCNIFVFCPYSLPSPSCFFSLLPLVLPLFANSPPSTSMSSYWHILYKVIFHYDTYFR